MGETYFDQQDVQQNKTVVMVTAILQLFFPFVFFIPLLACKDSPYGRFYSNQGLLLFILWVIYLIASKIPLIGWLIYIVIGVTALVFGIINAVNANKGIRKGIPLLGEIEIIK